MEETDAVSALAAVAQDNRLDVYRLLCGQALSNVASIRISR